jgi:hypothetical protein
VELLKCYYQIENTFDVDKFRYIFDKFEEHYIVQEKIFLSGKELSELLTLYGKLQLGSDLFYKKMFIRFEEIKIQMEVPEIIICGWAFVRHNYWRKNKALRVYHPDVQQRVKNGIGELNSYLIKQYLWAYHKENEIFNLS